MGRLIDSIRVGGVRSFKSPQQLDLRPITLIFGPNSSGKSSLLEAIALILQSNDPGRPNPLNLATEGRLYSEGGFVSVVSDHDTNQTMELGVSIPSERQSGFIQLSSRYRYNQELGVGTLASISCGLADHDLQLRMTLRPPRSTAVSRKRNSAVFVPSKAEDSRALARLLNFKEGSDINDPMRFSFDASCHIPGDLRRVVFSGGDSIDDRQFEDLNGRWLDLWSGITSELRNAYENAVYLGPLRDLGALVVTRDSGTTFNPDRFGASTVTDLADSDELSAAVGGWLDRLGIRYLPRVLNLKAETGEVPGTAVHSLVLEDRETGLVLSARDVGFGVSQVLPIVATALSRNSSLVLVEQPEIHLHPRLQAELGELLVQSARSRGNQFVLETHSEHLLLRMRRLIRRGEIPPSFLSVVYVDLARDGSADIFPIELDEEGHFVDEWPDGFFPERFDELFGE